MYYYAIQDPHSSGGRIILVHSLVPGGSAMSDGRLKVGDKLLSVNQVSLANQSLRFAAQHLLAIQPGRIAMIGVCQRYIQRGRGAQVNHGAKEKQTREEEKHG